MFLLVGGAAAERRLSLEVTRVLQTPPCLEGKSIHVVNDQTTHTASINIHRLVVFAGAYR